MNKKIGQLIKARVDSSNLTVTDFAKKIGAERSNVYNIFQRSSIDTDLLKKIGQILHYDFFQDLLEEETLKELSLKERIDNKVYISIYLSDKEIEQLGLKEKVIKEIKNEY